MFRGREKFIALVRQVSVAVKNRYEIRASSEITLSFNEISGKHRVTANYRQQEENMSSGIKHLFVQSLFLGHDYVISEWLYE